MTEIVRTIVGETSNPYILTKHDFVKDRYKAQLRAVGTESNKLLQEKQITENHIRRWYGRGDIEVVVPRNGHDGTFRIVTGRNSAVPKTVLEAKSNYGEITKLCTLDLDFLNSAKRIPNSAKRVINLVSKFLLR